MEMELLYQRRSGKERTRGDGKSRTFSEMGNGIERHVLYCVTSRILLQKSKCVHNIIQEREAVILRMPFFLIMLIVKFECTMVYKYQVYYSRFFSKYLSRRALKMTRELVDTISLGRQFQVLRTRCENDLWSCPGISLAIMKSCPPHSSVLVLK